MPTRLNAGQSGNWTPQLWTALLLGCLLLLNLVLSSPAQAHDMTPLLVLFAPGYLLAPLGAAAAKGLILAMRGSDRARRSLVLALLGFAAMEFVIWQVLYPVGALFEYRLIPGWRVGYLILAGLAILGFLTVANGRLIRWAGRQEDTERETEETTAPTRKLTIGRAVLALLFALATPISLLAFSAIAVGIGNLL